DRGIASGFRQNKSPHALPLVGPIVLAIAEGQGVAMRAMRVLGREVGSGQFLRRVLADGTRHAQGVDARFQAVLAALEGERKSILLAFNRAGETPFHLPALLGWTLDGKSVARIQPVIP